MWNKRNSLGLMVVWTASLWACSSAAPDQGTGTDPSTTQQAGSPATAPTAGKVGAAPSAGTSGGAKAGSGAMTSGTAGTPAIASGGASGKPAASASAGTGGSSASAAAGSGGSMTAATAGAGAAAGGGAAGAAVGGESPATCSASTLKPGDTTMMTAVGARDGGMRTYIVHVPTSYDGTKAVPLMVNFHPLIFGTGAGQRAMSGWAEIGDQDGIITAFPDGYDAAWDIGNCCTRGDVDDLAFARAIVSEISAAACIDSNRVYASGYSMGAGMSHLLGCKAADIFAAIAPSAFDLTKENHIPCEPSRPLTVFMHRAMDDNVVPWNGGPTTPPNGTPVTVTMLGAIGTFDEWARINNCTDEPVMEGNCHHHKKCDQGVEVVLCEIMGHTEGPAPVIWDTLQKHGLKGPL